MRTVKMSTKKERGRSLQGNRENDSLCLGNKT